MLRELESENEALRIKLAEKTIEVQQLKANLESVPNDAERLIQEIAAPVLKCVGESLFKKGVVGLCVACHTTELEMVASDIKYDCYCCDNGCVIKYICDACVAKMNRKCCICSVGKITRVLNAKLSLDDDIFDDIPLAYRFVPRKSKYFSR